MAWGMFRSFGALQRWRQGHRHERKGKPVSGHSIRDYERLVRHKLREHPHDRELALAQSIGSPTMDVFRDWGRRQVEVLRYHGLSDGMAIYDLGCGCGRTAQELQRSGWQGIYHGADIISELVQEVIRTCPGYRAIVHRELSIAAPDASLDMVFHWSVFTHLYPEEGYIYLEDIFRALKPGGKLVFSFLELGNPRHFDIFAVNVGKLKHGTRLTHLDQFLHRDWIAEFALRVGFGEPAFTDADDTRHHAAFGQSLVVMSKPG